METTMNTILKSQRGKDILVDELYYQYHQNYTRNNLIYWECSQRKAKCCRARLITKLRIQNYEILRKISEHNHSARKSEIVAKKALSELKDKAGTNGSSTRDLITTCVASIDAACRAELPALQTISRNVRRWKRDDDLPSVSTGRNDL